MKLTIQVGGRDALPIRGIALATNGGLTVRDVCNMLADPGYLCGVCTPKVFRIGATGQTEDLHPALFNPTLAHFNKAVSANASELDEIRMLPSAVFVWADEMRKVFEDFHEEVWQQRLQRNIDKEPLGMWNTAPISTSEYRMVILEGCTDIVGPTSRPHGKATPAPNDSRINHEWQQIAESKAAEMKAAKKRSPTKRAVAGAIASTVSAGSETVERCIRKSW